MRAPPYLISFQDVESYLFALSVDKRSLYEADILRLVEKKYPPIVSMTTLGILFGFSPKFIGSLYNKTEKYYRVFEIKKGKKKRRIESPKVGLKVIQKWIAEYLSKALQFDDCVYGFIPNKSYIEAAEQHVGAKWVYSVDIKDFFQSTPKEKVVNALKELGYSDNGAELAAKLCTYKGYLAQGSPASPVLSNLVFKSLDIKIKKKSIDLGVVYTRYADDLVFSGKESFPETLKEIKNLIRQEGWELSDKKEYLAASPNRLKVHGLLVHKDRINLTKGYRNKLRAYRHLIKNHKIKEPDIPIIQGHINFADHIEKYR